MAEFTARVQELGRIVIPRTVREFEGIEKGDFVNVSLTKAKRPEKQ